MRRPGQLLLLTGALMAGLVYSLFASRPALYDVSYLLLLALLVAWTWRGWRAAVPPTLAAPALAFGGAYALAALASTAPARSLRDAAIVAGYGLLFMLAGNLLARGLSRAVLFRAVTMAALVVAGVAAGAWLLDGAPLTGYRLRLETNNSVALYNLLLFPALTAGQAVPLVVAPAVFLTWFAGSRGGLVANLTGLFALVGILPLLRRYWPVLLAGLVAMGALLLLYMNGLAHGGRSELWGVGWEMFSARPWLGQGPGTYQAAFMAAYPDWAKYNHAHNAVLNLLAETGVLGLGAAFWLAVASGRALWRQVQAGDPWAVGALAGAVALAAQSLVDVPTTRGYVVVALLVVVRLGLQLPSPEAAGAPGETEHRASWRWLPAPHVESGDGAGSIATSGVENL
ncbi:MAG: O-antigen ligase family protein [Anaerolineales bacterium]|nr:O-antigen ligase family protein [Anaerolineales bacterium]